MGTEGTNRRDPIHVGEGDLGCVLNRTSRLLRLRLANALRDQGLTDMEYIVLQSIVSSWEEHGQPISASLVAQITSLPYDGIETSSAQLVGQGWIIGRDGGGAMLYEPSAKSLRLDSAIKSTPRWLFETALNGFSNEEIDQLMELLNRVYRNLREL